MKKLIIVAAIAAACVGGLSYANHTAAEKVRSELDKQLAIVTEQTGATFAYADLSANVLAKNIEITDLEIINPEGESVANIQSIEISGYEKDEVAPHTAFDIKNLHFNENFIAKLPAESNSMLASASYDIHSSLDYDEESGDSDIALDFNAKDIFHFSMNMGLANSKALMDASVAIAKAQQEAGAGELSYEQQLQQQTLVMAAMSKLEARTINLALKNEGELKSLIKSELAKQGMNVEQMQMMVDQQLQALPVTDDVVQSVNAFTKGLNSFNISAGLPEGKPMMEVSQQIMMLMSQPEELAKFISLEVSGS